MNKLYPIFLKMSQIPTLLVGAGKVGTEKIHFLLKSSPDAIVTVVADWVSPEFLDETKDFPNVRIIQKSFSFSDLDGHRLLIAATGNPPLNLQLVEAAHRRNILVNIADTPDMCDFYLGGIVTKGDLKLAISTNGRSPTLAKRLRQFFEAVLPNDLNQLFDNLQAYRQTLKGDFETKVRLLEKATEGFLASPKKAIDLNQH